MPTIGSGDLLDRDAAAVAVNNHYTVGFIANTSGLKSLQLKLRNHPGVAIEVSGFPVTVVNEADTPDVR